MTRAVIGVPTAQTIIAIDGGNSKTDIVLLSGNGTVLHQARSGPFAPHKIGAVAAVDSLTEAVEDVLARTSSGTVDHIAAYLANADLPVDEQDIRAAIVAKGWATEVVVGNDTFALLRAGTRSADAVALVCGGGINCVGVSAAGNLVRYPALGRITGDWGGGIGLAKEVLWHTSRHEDGRGAPTALTTAVADHFSLPTAVAVAEAMHLRAIDYDRMHELVPILFTVAESGDVIAAGIVQRQAEEIVVLVIVTLRRLGLLDRPADVVLGGGILASARPILLDVVMNGIAEQAPLARILMFDGNPVVGAALLGLELAWVGSDTAERDRALARLPQFLGETRG